MQNSINLIIVLCGSIAVILLLIVIIWQILIPAFVRRAMITFLVTLGDPERKKSKDDTVEAIKKLPHAEERIERAESSHDFDESVARYRPDIGPHTTESLKVQSTSEVSSVHPVFRAASRPFRFLRWQLSSKKTRAKPDFLPDRREEEEDDD